MNSPAWVFTTEMVRVVDFDVKAGVTADEGSGDEWRDA